MLEFVACAFGGINPLLGQMAPSPCRADKPLLHRFGVCVHVGVFHPQKNLYWQDSFGQDGGQICLGFWNMTTVC